MFGEPIDIVNLDIPFIKIRAMDVDAPPDSGFKNLKELEINEGHFPKNQICTLKSYRVTR